MSPSGGSVITLPVARAMRDVSEAVTADLRAWGTLDGPAGRTRSSPVAQLAEHATVNRRVSGSSPLGGASSQVSGLMCSARPTHLLRHGPGEHPLDLQCGVLVAQGASPATSPTVDGSPSPARNEQAGSAHVTRPSRMPRRRLRPGCAHPV